MTARASTATRAAEQATPVPGWESEPGLTVELKMNGERSNSPRSRVPGYGFELLGLVWDVETNRRVAGNIRVTLPGGRCFVTEVSHEALRSGQTGTAIWHRHGVLLPNDIAATAKRWLSRALTVLEAPTIRSVTRPTLHQGRLRLPSELDRVAEIDEMRARECWRTIVQTVEQRGLDGAALAIGAARISPLLRQLGRPGFLVNLIDNSTTGKTSSARISLAQFYKPDPVGEEPTWNRTENELLKLLGEANILPVLLDDTASARHHDRPERFLGDAVMAISTGRSRGRLDSSTERQEERRWRLVAISTGETSIFGAARVGASARALELTGPFMPSAEVADELFALSREAWGWPRRWLDPAALLTVPELPRTGSRVGDRRAPLIALCAAGWADLARVLDVQTDPAALAGRELRRQEEALSELGATAEDRFWSALMHEWGANPDAFPVPTGGDTYSVPFGRDLRGVYRGGELWAFTETVKRIAEEVQCSLSTVLRELEGQGLHVVKTGSRGRVERATVNDARVDAYVFTPRDGDAPGTGQVAQAEVDHAVDRVASFA